MFSGCRERQKIEESNKIAVCRKKVSFRHLCCLSTAQLQQSRQWDNRIGSVRPSVSQRSHSKEQQTPFFFHCRFYYFMPYELRNGAISLQYHCERGFRVRVRWTSPLARCQYLLNSHILNILRSTEHLRSGPGVR